RAGTARFVARRKACFLTRNVGPSADEEKGWNEQWKDEAMTFSHGSNSLRQSVVGGRWSVVSGRRSVKTGRLPGIQRAYHAPTSTRWHRSQSPSLDPRQSA